MALVFVNGGEDLALKALLNHTAGQNLVLRLYRNDQTPVDTHTSSDYTEANFTGYAAVTLTGSSWSVSGGVSSYAQQSFTSSAGSQNQDVYGYYMTQTSSGLLVYAERFTNGPYNIADNGDVIRVTPQILAD